jgi:CheY-like chemotaxis protein
VQQILDFSRRAILETEPLDLVPFTQDVINVLKRTIPENIRIELNLACRHCVIEADPTRIQQVLINLALNARDAMPGGGKLWIDLASMNLDPNDPPPIPGMDPGEWAHLRVSDTGIGMTNEVMEHLFEPFFTTKEPGRGTGLGLSQVYGIVKQHEGYIDVESKPHKGSTFSIYLPAETPAVNEQENWAPEEVATGQGETILLVEDADALRAAIESFLESLGYRVLSAENGRKALQLAASEKLDMLITDIVMPEMGGAELLHHIRRVDPDLKAIAITGHMLHAETVSLLDAGFDEHMSKPFDTKQLSAIIQTLLEEENPS